MGLLGKTAKSVKGLFDQYDMDLYHGTYNDIDQFDPDMVDIGVHLGTPQQAKNRLNDTFDPYGGGARFKSENYRGGANVIPVKVRSGGVLEMEDVGDWKDSQQVLSELTKNPLFKNDPVINDLIGYADEIQPTYSGGEMSWRDSPENREVLDDIRNHLQSEGFDTVKYLNQVENAYGSDAGLTDAATQSRELIFNRISEMLKVAHTRGPSIDSVPEPSAPNFKEKMDDFLNGKPSYTNAETVELEKLRADARLIESSPESQIDPNSYISLDPDRNVRSRFAKFESERGDLLASSPVATAAAGAGGLLAMAGSDDADAGVLGKAKGLLMDTPSRMARAKEQGFDTSTNWYHGTSDLANISETGFDPDFTGKGNDQFGSGFYFSTSPSQSSSYAETGLDIAGNTKPAGMVKANLALKNPLIVDGMKVTNLNDLPIELDYDDVSDLLQYSRALKRGLDDEQMNPMGDQFSEFWDDGPTDEMMEKLVETYQHSNLSAIENDLFDGDSTAFREGLAKVTGYDGIVVDYGDGLKNAVAWEPNQIRSTSAKFDPRKRNRRDLVASNPAATLGSAVLGNTIGQQSKGLINAIAGRDSILQPQEVEYLRLQKKLQDLLGSKDLEKFNYSDLLPLKRNIESGDYSPAMTGLLRDIIEGVHDVAQSSKTNVTNQQSLWDIIL